MNELERIRKAYEKRKINKIENRYSYFNRANLFIIHQREKALIELLRQLELMDLSDKRILDVGCGSGGFLREFIKYGARPGNLFGIDLLEERIDRAKYLSPKIDLRCGDASELPYDDHSFDMVMQFGVFTSILDVGMKKKMAFEMCRVLRQDGIVIWYDYHMNNPMNRDVRGVHKREIFELFPDCAIYLKRVTLAPPITRMLVPFSIILCELLEKFPFLCTHYLGVIRKKKAVD